MKKQKQAWEIQKLPSLEGYHKCFKCEHDEFAQSSLSYMMRRSGKRLAFKAVCAECGAAYRFEYGDGYLNMSELKES